jgi:hypothetical protein
MHKTNAERHSLQAITVISNAVLSRVMLKEVSDRVCQSTIVTQDKWMKYSKSFICITYHSHSHIHIALSVLSDLYYIYTFVCLIYV